MVSLTVVNTGILNGTVFKIIHTWNFLVLMGYLLLPMMKSVCFLLAFQASRMIAWITPQGTSHSLSPTTSVECQLPTSATIASSLARKLMDGTVASELTGNRVRFSKVFGIGHSLGSRTLNYAAIIDGRVSPFIGFILTGRFQMLFARKVLVLINIR